MPVPHTGRISMGVLVSVRASVIVCDCVRECGVCACVRACEGGMGWVDAPGVI